MDNGLARNANLLKCDIKDKEQGGGAMRILVLGKLCSRPLSVGKLMHLWCALARGLGWRRRCRGYGCTCWKLGSKETSRGPDTEEPNLKMGRGREAGKGKS